MVPLISKPKGAGKDLWNVLLVDSANFQSAGLGMGEMLYMVVYPDDRGCKQIGVCLLYGCGVDFDDDFAFAGCRGWEVADVGVI